MRSCTHKAKQGIHPVLPISRQVFSHFQQSRVPSCLTVAWEDKCHDSKCPPRCLYPSFIPERYVIYIVWDIPLASWGQLSWLCPLAAPCAPPACSLSGQQEGLKTSRLCVSAALQQQKRQCVINIGLITNPKHSTL